MLSGWSTRSKPSEPADDAIAERRLSLPQLPTELLGLVVEASDNLDRLHTLTTLSLVSSTFLSLARPHLYATVRLTSAKAARLFLRTLKDNPALAKRVKELALEGKVPDERPGEETRWRVPKGLVGLCVKLDVLVLRGVDIDPNEALVNTTFKSLLLSRTHLSPAASAAAASPCIPSLPSLRHLTLDLIQLPGSLITPFLSLPTFPSLHSFSLTQAYSYNRFSLLSLVFFETIESLPWEAYHALLEQRVKETLVWTPVMSFVVDALPATAPPIPLTNLVVDLASFERADPLPALLAPSLPLLPQTVILWFDAGGSDEDKTNVFVSLETSLRDRRALKDLTRLELWGATDQDAAILAGVAEARELEVVAKDWKDAPTRDRLAAARFWNV